MVPDSLISTENREMNKIFKGFEVAHILVRDEPWATDNNHLVMEGSKQI